MVVLLKQVASRGETRQEQPLSRARTPLPIHPSVKQSQSTLPTVTASKGDPQTCDSCEFPSPTSLPHPWLVGD
eukprot:3303856-Amphidinium_carterae.1